MLCVEIIAKQATCTNQKMTAGRNDVTQCVLVGVPQLAQEDGLFFPLRRWGIDTSLYKIDTV